MEDDAMKTLVLSVAFACALIQQAGAWGEEGHSIVAEVAQQRLSVPAAAIVQRLLKGRSLASVASWADDVRTERPETSNWHFVDIPLARLKYSEPRDCRANAQKGDCIVKALSRLKNDLRCTTGDNQVEALKFSVHFIGDIHQPLHTVDDQTGGNELQVDVFMRGMTTCTDKNTCKAVHAPMNFHAVWDSGLINKTTWNWGAYVNRLEDGWLMSVDANRPGIDGGTPADWANQSHEAALTIWHARPTDEVLDDRYYREMLPTLDRQLGMAGLRLAKFINDAFGSDQCPVP
jgi:nuclease S1